MEAAIPAVCGPYSVKRPLVIIGGGPAGATAALVLAQAGERPMLIERERVARHKICGEFLSVEAQVSLAAAGLDIWAMGAAPISRLRLVRGRRVAESALPFKAAGLTRKRLDEDLLTRAGLAGARIERAVAVREVRGSQIVIDGHRTMLTDRLLLASGKHEIRGMRRPARGTVSGLIGFKTYFHLSPGQDARLQDHIEVLMFAGGYAGLQHVEGGMANLCLLVTADRLAAAGGNWPGLLAQLRRDCGHLEDRLSGAEELIDRPITIAGVPYGYLHRDVGDGIFRLGDQFAVIPSFSGDGMSIAMHSGRTAARAILGGQVAATYHAERRRELAPQVRLADWLYRLTRPSPMQALAVHAGQMWPGLLSRIAMATRVPDAALRKSGLT